MTDVNDFQRKIADLRRQLQEAGLRPPAQGFGGPGASLGGMRLRTMPPVTVTRVVRNKSGSHPFIHWLARWLPIDPYVEWDWPEQVPDDHVYFAKGMMFAPPHIRRALIEQTRRAEKGADR